MKFLYLVLIAVLAGCSSTPTQQVVGPQGAVIYTRPANYYGGDTNNLTLVYNKYPEQVNVRQAYVRPVEQRSRYDWQRQPDRPATGHGDHWGGRDFGHYAQPHPAPRPQGPMPGNYQPHPAPRPQGPMPGNYQPQRPPGPQGPVPGNYQPQRPPGPQASPIHQAPARVIGVRYAPAPSRGNHR